MTSSILAVFDDLEFGREVKKALEKDFNGLGGGVVTLARNRMEAEGILGSGHFKIVIADLLIAESSEVSRDEEGCHALALLKELDQRDNHPHSVLVVPAAMPLQRQRSIQDAVKAIPNCYQLNRSVVEDAKDLTDKLKGWCHDLAKIPSGGNSQLRYLEIVIDLRDEVPQYRLEGKGFAFRWESEIKKKRHVLSFSEQTENLILLSQAITNRKDWQRYFREISKQLSECLFEENFSNKIAEGISKLGGNLSNTKLCFFVRDDNHPILLEALRYFDNTRYWMLQAPVYRRIPVHRANRYPLFCGNDRKDALAPQNWLFIHSQVEGEVGDILVSDGNGDRPLGLCKLDNLDTECEQIGALLKEQLKGQIANVEILKHEPGENFWEKVKKKLSSGKWDVVHYAGHTFFDDNKKKGYLFFQDDLIIRHVEIEDFSYRLQDAEARLVFLSSCHSSHENFIFELAQEGVPAIVGFRWDIEDILAAEYSVLFYEALLRTKNLHQAFLESKQQMHERNKNHYVWASPILVSQL